MSEQTNQQTDFANQWINKQMAIDALGEKPLVWDDLSDFDLGKAAQWSDDVDAIKELPSVQPETHEERTKTRACDCIDRQAAIDTIDKIFPADPMRNDYTQGITCGAALAEEHIKQLPSAQQEIIRCRDCKHYHYADSHIPQEQMCTCDLDGDRLAPDSYCSFAERREDE